MDDVIERLTRRAANDADAIPLGGALPHASMFPHDALEKAFTRVVRADGSAALQYGWPEGRPKLRAQIAARLRARGADVLADDVIITSGAQQAIAIATQLGSRDGEAIACAPESYPAALDLFRRSGLEPRASAMSGLAYVMPAIDNPRGRAMGERERVTLLAHATVVLEDDAYADLSFVKGPRPPLISRAREKVHYIGSFSKTLSPGLRVGFLVPPRAMLDEVRALKQTLDLQANSLSQALVEHFLETNDFDTHLARLRGAYAVRADRLCRALRARLPELRFDMPEGGFSVWVETARPVDQIALLRRAVAHGTSFDPGAGFLADTDATTCGFRLTYSAADAEDLDEGVRRLALAYREHVSLDAAWREDCTPSSSTSEGTNT